MSFPSAKEMRRRALQYRSPEDIASEKIQKAISILIMDAGSKGKMSAIYRFPFQITDVPVFDRAGAFSKIADFLYEKGYNFTVEGDEEMVITWDDNDNEDPTNTNDAESTNTNDVNMDSLRKKYTRTKA